MPKKLKKRKSSRKRSKVKKRKNKKKIKKNVSQELIYKVKSDWIKKAVINKSGYEKKYSESIKNNDSFWKKEGKRITWIKPYTKVKDFKYSKEDVHIKWYYDGTLNASANCIDRHLKRNPKKFPTKLAFKKYDPVVRKHVEFKEQKLK